MNSRGRENERTINASNAYMPHLPVPIELLIFDQHHEKRHPQLHPSFARRIYAACLCLVCCEHAKKVIIDQLVWRTGYRTCGSLDLNSHFTF